MYIAGKVAVYGIQGTVAFTGLLVTENKLVDWDFSDSADAGETKTGSNHFHSVSSSGDMAKANITIIPFDPDTPGTLATAKSKIVLPAALAKVTITAPALPINGDWHYARAKGGSVKPDSSGQALKVSLPLERFDTGDGNGPKYLGDPILIPVS